MKNGFLSLTALAMVCCCTLPVFAQKDTSRLDIGWLSLDKRFTQTFTIKGEDLEKMPFINLSDAISAWLYGAYTRPTTLAYVVDGNPVTDVNVFPIYDIEEVTLVEQAAGAAAYGGSQQELVVITTRYGKGKSGMRAAAQAGLVDANNNGVSTHSNVYHQYYLSAYRNMTQLSAGVSADWIRDVSPLPSGVNYQVINPSNLERWRLNGYVIWRPTKNNVVELRASYAPQQAKEGLDSIFYQDLYQVRSSNHSHLLVPELSWHSRLLRGLTNEFHVTYLSGLENAAFHLTDTYTGAYPVPPEGYEDTILSRVGQFFLRDRLSYDVSAGSWHIDPAINFSYDHITEKTASSISSFSLNNLGQPVETDVPVGPWQEQHGDLSYLTPTVDIRKGEVLEVQLGAQMNVSHRQDTGARSVFPFATMGLDLLRLVHATGIGSLKIFGSYAQRAQVFVDDYSLSDFSSTGSPYSLANVYHSRSTPATFTTINNGDTVTETVQIPNERLPVFWTWSAGVSFTTADGRVQLQYVFEKRNFVTPGELSYMGFNPSGYTGGLVGVPGWNSTQHHIGVRVKVIDSKKSSWQTSLNLTLLRSQYVSPFTTDFILALGGSASYTYDIPYLPTGDIRPASLSYAGGWVNRWQVGHFMAGLDLLYHFGESVQEPGLFAVATNGPKINSFMVPNIYAGYNWRLGESRVLELFVDSRGLVHNKSSDLLDERRYYTVGGKLSL